MYKTVRLFVYVSVRVCLEMTSVDKLLDLTFSLYYAYFFEVGRNVSLFYKRYIIVP